MRSRPRPRPRTNRERRAMFARMKGKLPPGTRIQIVGDKAIVMLPTGLVAVGPAKDVITTRPQTRSAVEIRPARHPRRRRS